MSLPAQFKVEWFDLKREPRCEPDPNFPNGIALDVSDGAYTSCTVELPYPAKRCGHYIISCRLCGLTSLVTTAGRPDDPRSVKLACKLLS
jgi:hypothetical protein